jgi:hypothetical protein
MKLHEYKQSEDIAQKGYQFYALIMAAMRQADNVNLARLRGAFPKVYYELNARYMSPGGVLEEEREG